MSDCEKAAMMLRFLLSPDGGYYDLHHADEGAMPDGSDVVGEGYASMKEIRAEARDLANLDRIR